MKLCRLLSLLVVAGSAVLACGDVHSDLITGPSVQCHTSTDCPSAQTCLSGACVNACASHRDCPETAPACDVPSGRCGPCTAQEACAGRSAPHCNLASGRCVECLDPTDCTGVDDRTFCSVRGRCVECLPPDDGSCEEANEKCSDELGECAVPCGGTGDCPPSEPICYGAIGFCVECTENRHCGNGVVCRGFECQR